VLKAVEKIIDTIGRYVDVEVIYTDDWQKDHNILVQPFEARKLKVFLRQTNKKVTFYLEASYLPRYMAC
jgi:hypothetical protein